MMQTPLLECKREETNASCSGYPGLENLGNTCFLNSVLQVLAYSPKLAKNLTDLKPSIQRVVNGNETNDDDKAKLKFSIELESILCQIRSRILNSNIKAECVKPNNLMESLRSVCPLFEPHTQQDVHECLNCILNIINDVINLVLTANAVEHKLPTRKEGLFKLFGGRNGNVTVKKQNNENLDPTHQNKPTVRSLNVKSPILKSTNRKVLAPRPNKFVVGKKYSPLSPYKQGNIAGSSNDEDSKRVHTPTGGCYERFKRKRYNLNTQSSYDVEKQTEGVKATNFYSKLSPPAKRKRTSLFSDTRKTLPMLKSKKLFPVKKTKNKFFPLQFKSKTILSDGSKKICDQITSEENEKPADTNFIKELFCGELANTNKCLECESSQIRKETFMDLSLPVKESKEVINKTSDGNSESLFEESESSCLSCSLSWSFSEFAKTEILSGENMYSCENCQRLVEASQCVKFLSLPSVLNIHLKRFSTQMLGNNESPISIINKNNISFTVPRSCSVKEWCSSSCISNDAEYKLYAIIVHRGSTMFSGHYLSYVNVGENEDDIWLEADDDNTKVVSPDELDEILLSTNQNSFTAHTPYMLFYHKLQ